MFVYQHTNNCSWYRPEREDTIVCEAGDVNALRYASHFVHTFLLFSTVRAQENSRMFSSWPAALWTVDHDVPQTNQCFKALRVQMTFHSVICGVVTNHTKLLFQISELQKPWCLYCIRKSTQTHSMNWIVYLFSHFIFSNFKWTIFNYFIW